LHLMFCESLILKANDINFFFPEVKSIAKIKSLNISSRDSLFELDSFSFQPTEEDIDFFKGNKYRNDRWEIYIKELKCSSFNLSKYIWEKIIQIENISIDAGYLDILTNMRLQLPPNFNPKMPQEIINEINFDPNLRHIDLNIDSIVTRELYPYYDQPSRLPFKNIKGEIFNLSSMTGFQNQRIPSIFKISALLAGEGVLKINMEIPLSGGRADFNYSGSLGEMTVHPLNDHLIISDLVQLTSGKIDSVIFNVISKKGLVSVSIAPYYKKLKIKNIDKETMKGSGVLNAIQTFIANTFKIRVENPDKSDILKKGDEIYKIKEEDTFLDIIWESLKKALGEVVGF